MPLHTPITVVIAHFDDLFARGLRELIESDPSLTILAADVEHRRIAVVLRAHRPDVAILDVGALGKPAEVRELSAWNPGTRLVLLGNDPAPVECAQLLPSRPRRLHPRRARRAARARLRARASSAGAFAPAPDRHAVGASSARTGNATQLTCVRSLAPSAGLPRHCRDGLTLTQAVALCREDVVGRPAQGSVNVRMYDVVPLEAVATELRARSA